MKITNEIKVGAMVCAVAVILLYLTIRTGGLDFAEKGYLLKVHFKNVDGIAENAPVMLEGLEVGRVKDMNINYDNQDTNMELTLWIEERALVREGAKAYVKNLGFMGEKYVGLTSGDVGKPYLTAEAIIVGEQPADFEKLVRDGQDIAIHVKGIAKNLDERLELNKGHIDDIFLNLDTSLDHIVSISANLDERLKLNEDKIDSIVAHLDVSSRNLEEMTGDLKVNPWKLLYRDKTKKSLPK